MLACLGLLILLHVGRARLAVDALYFEIRLEVSLLHLQQHQFARERHHADVVARLRFNSHNVALLQVEVVVVAVKALAGVFELHLNKVRCVNITRHISQIVVRVELVVAASAAIGRQSAQVAIAPFAKVASFAVAVVLAASRAAVARAVQASVRLVQCVVCGVCGYVVILSHFMIEGFGQTTLFAFIESAA